MKYHGKNYLYKFLQEHGYDVPMRKDMEYTFYRGSEWLRSYLLEAYSPKRDVIYITLKEEDVDNDKIVEIEYSKYVNGVIDYQVKRGHRTI